MLQDFKWSLQRDTLPLECCTCILYYKWQKGYPFLIPWNCTHCTWHASSTWSSRCHPLFLFFFFLNLFFKCKVFFFSFLVSCSISSWDWLGRVVEMRWKRTHVMWWNIWNQMFVALTAAAYAFPSKVTKSMSNLWWSTHLLYNRMHASLHQI